MHHHAETWVVATLLCACATTVTDGAEDLTGTEPLETPDAAVAGDAAGRTTPEPARRPDATAASDAGKTVTAQPLEPPDAAVASTSSSAGACPPEAFFCNNFETALYGEDGSARLYRRNVSSGNTQGLSGNITHSGKQAIQFSFGPGANNELGFRLGANYSDVFIRYYVYYPDGTEDNEIRYAHRDGPSSDNNKMIRIFGDEYTNPNKMGASTTRTSEGVTRLYLETKVSGDYPSPWTCAGSMSGLRDPNNLSAKAPAYTMPEAALGRWQALEFHFKSDSGAGDGAIEMWIDGVRQSGFTNVSVGGAPCTPTYFNEGYILGTANSGYDQPTNIYVDDVVFSTQYIGP